MGGGQPSKVPKWHLENPLQHNDLRYGQCAMASGRFIRPGNRWSAAPRLQQTCGKSHITHEEGIVGLLDEPEPKRLLPWGQPGPRQGSILGRLGPPWAASRAPSLGRHVSPPSSPTAAATVPAGGGVCDGMGCTPIALPGSPPSSPRPSCHRAQFIFFLCVVASSIASRAWRTWPSPLDLLACSPSRAGPRPAGRSSGRLRVRCAAARGVPAWCWRRPPRHLADDPDPHALARVGGGN